MLLLQPFNNWMDGAKEDLVDMFIVHTTEEIQVRLPSSYLDHTAHCCLFRKIVVRKSNKVFPCFCGCTMVL